MLARALAEPFGRHHERYARVAGTAGPHQIFRLAVIFVAVDVMHFRCRAFATETALFGRPRPDIVLIRAVTLGPISDRPHRLTVRIQNNASTAEDHSRVATHNASKTAMPR